MKIWLLFIKGLKQQLRDLVNLGFVLAITPCFILLYFLMTSGSTTQYQIGLIKPFPKDVQELILKAEHANKDLIFNVRKINQNQAVDLIEEGDLHLALAWQNKYENAGKTKIHLYGNPAHVMYIPAASIVWNLVESTLSERSEIPPSYQIIEHFIGNAINRSEFDNYIPGLLVVSIILIVFLVAINVARDYESSGFTRLRLTNIGAIDYLLGNSAVYLCISVINIIISLAFAVFLGFDAGNALFSIFLVLLLTAISIIGIGFLTAVFCKNTVQAYVLASLPFMLLMFFSGSIYPIKKIVLFSVAGKQIALFDFLPSVHAVQAMNKLLIMGKTLGFIVPELMSITILSIIYFCIGFLVMRWKYFSSS